MTFDTFDEFFLKATGQQRFPYQAEFANAKGLFELIYAPTGAGKTAAAILGWLWRRRYAGEDVRASTPRRLAYCLPMRVLVEQTRDAANAWLDQLGLRDEVKVHVLMGGEESEEWDLTPEGDAVLIGTQDMLLSRALNRGYGMSRFRWPMHFGLLNNDCLWVLDEIQLMGVGLATSAQMQAFRQQFGAYGHVETVWMSATLLPEWLRTVDFRAQVSALNTLALTNADYATPGLEERWIGKKPIDQAKAPAGDAAALAALIKEAHHPASLTLVVVNRVDRARDLFEALEKASTQRKSKVHGKKTSQPSEPGDQTPDIKLIHSRFRPIEREAWKDWLKEPWPDEGRIIISTQVVEAGVDVSARTLFTELAPWPSLVQRFGRCNRKGEFTGDRPARIYWIDVPAKDDKQAAPYSKSELDQARENLKERTDGGLTALHDFFEALSADERTKLFPFDPPHVIRRRDFLDLFDTTPDLSGNDIDVSRFIRQGDELDVQVFWRPGPPPRELEPKEARRIAPVRIELCPVPVGSFREFAGKANKVAYRWNGLDGNWVRASSDGVFPGQVFWMPRDQGGYSRKLGWDPKAGWDESLEMYTPPEDDAGSLTSEPEYDSDLLSLFGWQSIAEHTDAVVDELEAIERSMKLDGIPWKALWVAGRWHDWGKAHFVFQDAIGEESERDGTRPDGRRGKRDIAKAAPKGFWRKYVRKHFRHELASAMGVLTLLRQDGTPADWAGLSPEQQDLALYLIAAHHGKVRLSIRSMPDERKPGDPDRLFARGVWRGDKLPEVDLGNEVTAPNVEGLDLSPMQLGRCADGSPSWAERMLGLRDDPVIGPIRLAFLEVIIRAADMRASMKADQRARR